MFIGLSDEYFQVQPLGPYFFDNLCMSSKRLNEKTATLRISKGLTWLIINE
jgi:hypothetical protein